MHSRSTARLAMLRTSRNSCGVFVRVHDSAGEITRMVRTFLIDYFGNIKIGPDACLVDFSDNCAGKADERVDMAMTISADGLTLVRRR